MRTKTVEVALPEDQAAWLAAEAARVKPSKPSKSAIVSGLIAREMASEPDAPSTPTPEPTEEVA